VVCTRTCPVRRTSRWVRSHRFGAVLLVVAAAIFLLAIPQLPPLISTHLNARGEPNGVSPRGVWVGIISGAMVFLYLLLGLLPKIDPRKRNYEQFHDIYWLMGNAVLLFLLLVHVLVVGKGLGWGVNLTKVMFPGIGLLFVVMGRFLHRVEPNWFVGI